MTPSALKRKNFEDKYQDINNNKNFNRVMRVMAARYQKKIKNLKRSAKKIANTII